MDGLGIEVAVQISRVRVRSELERTGMPYLLNGEVVVLGIGCSNEGNYSIHSRDVGVRDR